MKRCEKFERTETPLGDRILLHTMVTGDDFCYSVTRFSGNEAETLYIGHDQTMAGDIFNEYRMEYLFD